MKTSADKVIVVPHPFRREKAWYRSRVFLGVVGELMMLLAWRWAVFHLYTLPPTSIAAFQSLTGQVIWGVVAIALTVAGIKGVENMMSMKQQVLSSAASTAQNLVSDLREDRHVREEKIEKIEHVVVGGEPGAPPVRPFSPIPDHDDTDAEEAVAPAIEGGNE